MLNESWQSSKRSAESVVSHILSIRSKLEKMKVISDDNLEKAQLQQKQWYDGMTRMPESESSNRTIWCFYYSQRPLAS